MRYLEYERVIGSPTSPQLSGEKKHICLGRVAENNYIICLQEIHGKDEFLQAIRLVPQFRLYGTFIPINLNAGGSAICIHKGLLPSGTMVTHVVTCQGWDHTVNIQSGDRNLVVINVHFELDLTLRNLRERLRFFTAHWPLYPEAHGVITRDFNICEPEEGRFNVWNQTFTDGDTGKAALFHSFFHHVLEITQPDFTKRDSTADGTFRTLSRIDRTFINLPMAESQDFHCYSHFSRILGNGPYRVTMQLYVSSYKSRLSGVTRANAFRVGYPNIPFSSQFWDSSATITNLLMTHSSRFADSKVILEKAGKRTVHELLRKTPSSPGAKLLTASTALRAYRNRHLGTLMHCCEAWEPVGKCFDRCSFECIDFRGLSQIIASLTPERIREREAEISNLLWTQTEKDNALAKCRLGLRAWRSKKPTLCHHAVTDEDGHSLENEDESGRGLCEH